MLYAVFDVACVPLLCRLIWTTVSKAPDNLRLNHVQILKKVVSKLNDGH